MILRGADEVMISDTTAHAAAMVDGGGWVVSWLPDQVLERSEATTAMVLAETVARMQTEGMTRVVDHRHELWPFLVRWAAELGLTGPDAVARISERPGEEPAAAAGSCDPGPIPVVVEPETVGTVTTVPVSPRAQVRVSTDVGRTGLTGLSIDTAAGESVTVALSVDQVDAVCEALAAAVPVPYLPQLSEVRVFTPGQVVGGESS